MRRKSNKNPNPYSSPVRTLRAGRKSKEIRRKT
jgi:hypothetical protein